MLESGSEILSEPVEYNLNDYDYKIDGDKLVINKKSIYPKTFNECQDYNQKVSSTLFIENEDIETDIKLQNLKNLLYCRNVYWKIAGEELGLNESWYPSISKVENYAIYRTDNRIKVGIIYPNSRILEFPTLKMRDDFYNNFVDLIKTCKEFL